MSRHTRTKSTRKFEASACRARQKRLQRVRTELKTEWRLGHVKPTDIVSVVRAAEQSHIRLKQLRHRRFLERKQRCEERRQRQLRQNWMAA